MKVLRIKLRQNQASYTREETLNNRMTYPLPPYSTVIGALHNACGYTSYHDMDISVQGRYRSMQKEVYVNHALLNSLQDDRSTLIWLKNKDALSGGYIRVAEALKGQGNSFRNRITIQACDEAYLQTYIELKEKDEALRQYEEKQLKSKESKWKEREAAWKKALKNPDISVEESRKIKLEIQQGKEEIKSLREAYRQERYEKVEEPLSHFRTLTKGPQTQEVLYDVELVLHIRAEDRVLADIMEKRNNFVSLGRSEDFIDLVEMKEVRLTNRIKDIHGLRKTYSMYVNADMVSADGKEIKDYFLVSDGGKKNARGTIYYISKRYRIEEKKRVFERIPCLYSSDVHIDSESKRAWLDEDGDYIVNLN